MFLFIVFALQESEMGANNLRGGGQRPTPPLKLTATMASRKLQALDFIKTYWSRWGGSPSLGEIAAELGVSNKRAHQLVEQLEREGLIRRGIEPPAPIDRFSQADAMWRLRQLGFRIDEDIVKVQDVETGLYPRPEEAGPFTNMPLPPLPHLDHERGAEEADPGLRGGDQDGEQSG
jgi:hypothetical protein